VSLPRPSVSRRGARSANARRARWLPRPATLLALLACAGPLLAGCARSPIVATAGKQVTFAWDARETRIARVHAQAISWCHRWRAPPAFLDDQVEGTRHRTTFVCRPRESRPVTRIS
jgi:hypothetical protein